MDAEDTLMGIMALLMVWATSKRTEEHNDTNVIDGEFKVLNTRNIEQGVVVH